MSESFLKRGNMIDNFLKEIRVQNNPTRKILLTLFLLIILKLGNNIPLPGLDQEALTKSFLQLENKNSMMQIISMYTGGGGGGSTLVSPFSLGIIPFINASILVDLLTALFPALEKIQSEEGESGRRKLLFYKKLLTFFFAIIQSYFLFSYLKSYFFTTEILDIILLIAELVSGTMIIVWLSQMIDTQGIGNGTSLIIFTNILVTFLNKTTLSTFSLNNFFLLQILVILFLMIFICISQTARLTIEVVSARQLTFLENKEKTNFLSKQGSNFQAKDSGLSIRLNQAGIFPVIIASNLLPFFNYLNENFFGNSKIFNNFIYYFLIIGFNYFYTIVFWDPEKIAEQLRKASVSLINITPGKETISYLENVVRSSSIMGGIILCIILFSYDFMKSLLNGYLLNQINISSLIILVGVAYEIQKTVRSLYKNNFELTT